MDSFSLQKYFSAKYPKFKCDGNGKCGFENDMLLWYEKVRGQYPCSKQGIPCDALYMDLNHLIFVCSKLFCCKDACSFATKVCDYASIIIDRMRPEKLIFIAMDGVVPMACIKHRRCSEFRNNKTKWKISNVKKHLIAAGKYSEDESNMSKEASFEMNHTMPGSKFMEDLIHKLHFLIKQNLNENKNWEKLSVILSDSNVAGSAKHKIMNFIHVIESQNLRENSYMHVIYSGDDDIILLSLASHVKLVTVVTENLPNICDLCKRSGHSFVECFGNVLLPAYDDMPLPKMNYFHIYVLVKYLNVETMNNFGNDFDVVVNDFVLIGFLFGITDFLPGIPSMDIKEGMFDHVWIKYRKYRRQGLGLTNKFGLIDIHNFMLFMKLILCDEDIILEDRAKSVKKYFQKSMQEYNENISAEHVRSDYYHHKFRVPYENEVQKASIEEISMEYFVGLDWMSRYFFQLECCSWTWSYNYSYAPFIHDLTNLNPDHVQEHLKNCLPDKSVPISPFEMQMLISTPAGGHVLPNPLALAMKQPPLCTYYCSKIWEHGMTYVEVYGGEGESLHFERHKAEADVCAADWRLFRTGQLDVRRSGCVMTIVPDCDIDKIRSVVDRILPQLTENERMRNSFGTNCVFVRRDSAVVRAAEQSLDAVEFEVEDHIDLAILQAISLPCNDGSPEESPNISKSTDCLSHELDTELENNASCCARDHRAGSNQEQHTGSFDATCIGGPCSKTVRCATCLATNTANNLIQEQIASSLNPNCHAAVQHYYPNKDEYRADEHVGASNNTNYLAQEQHNVGSNAGIIPEHEQTANEAGCRRKEQLSHGPGKASFQIDGSTVTGNEVSALKNVISFVMKQTQKQDMAPVVFDCGLMKDEASSFRHSGKESSRPSKFISYIGCKVTGEARVRRAEQEAREEEYAMKRLEIFMKKFRNL